VKISTRSRYGVRLMLELAVNKGQKPIFLRDIARNQEISEKYLSQIIIPLKASGLVNSYRGAHGGYNLSRDPSKITLREIVEALEGNLSLVECIDNPSACHRVSQCVAQDVWCKVSQAIAGTLESITLRDLVQKNQTKSDQVMTYSI
jgi:Rrf2 family protein